MAKSAAAAAADEEEKDNNCYVAQQNRSYCVSRVGAHKFPVPVVYNIFFSFFPSRRKKELLAYAHTLRGYSTHNTRACACVRFSLVSAEDTTWLLLLSAAVVGIYRHTDIYIYIYYSYCGGGGGPCTVFDSVRRRYRNGRRPARGGRRAAPFR